MTIGLSAVNISVPQKDIYYISWNLDACEGLGFLKTEDAKAGLVTIFAPSGLLEDVYGFIDGLRAEGIRIDIISVNEIQETRE